MTRPKVRRPVARRLYHAPDMMRAAWFAGHGKSASEIAEIIGGTTRVRVHSMLRKCGLSLVPKSSNEVVVMAVLRRPQLDSLQALATQRDTDAPALAARLLTILLGEPVLLKNLLDDHEDEAAAK